MNIYTSFYCQDDFCLDPTLKECTVCTPLLITNAQPQHSFILIRFIFILLNSHMNDNNYNNGNVYNSNNNNNTLSPLLS